MKYQIRPLGLWTGPVTNPRGSSGRFRSRWDDTIALLCSEVEHLGGDQIALQVDVTAGELRRDGMLRTHAKVGFPGVRVSFGSVHGPLTYATDQYEQQWSGSMPGWQANVRAIALSLQALRAVDRYGVTSRGEQYQGWTALSAEPAPLLMTRVQAAEFLAAHGDANPVDLIADPGVVARAFRTAARVLHPDRGGDPEQFRRLTEARALLVDAGGGGR